MKADTKKLCICTICACCKRVRDNNGAWKHVDQDMDDHADAKFSHTLCVACATKLYPEFVHKKGNV